MEDPNFIIQTVGALSYWGIFGLSLLANIVVPVPEEISLLALGYVTAAGTIKIYYVIPIVIAGLFISDIFVFWLSRKGNRYVKALEKRLRNTRFTRDEEYIKKHIKKIIFISRFITQFRAIGPIFAGSIKTPWKTFLAINFLALIIYVPLILFIGYYFHDHINRIIEGAGIVRNILLVLIAIFVLIWAGKFLRSLFFRDYVRTKRTEGYEKTWIPWVRKKIVTEEKEEKKEETASE